MLGTEARWVRAQGRARLRGAQSPVPYPAEGSRGSGAQTLLQGRQAREAADKALRFGALSQPPAPALCASGK